MNFTLAREIYGVPWCVDAVSFMQLNSILKNIQNGMVLENSTQKLNSISFLDFNSKVVSSESEYKDKKDVGFNGIGIINLNGVITKNGGASSNGTKFLSSALLQMKQDEKIKACMILTDSGGGSSAAVQLFVDSIIETKKVKPVYALIEKGGMAGSAAYGIISACTEIYSEDEMNIVGSVGTMIQFSGKAHGNVDKDGEKTVVLYASKSTEKNKAFNEAIDNDNYSLLIDELLDPVNENFVNMVLANRPLLKGTDYDDGHTVFSKDAVGTFIDGIASFDEVVAKIQSNLILQNKSKININSNLRTMTKESLQSEFPDVYLEIINIGIASEQDRVQSWLAYEKADPKAVAVGVASGLQITNAQAHGFQATLARFGLLNDLQEDSIDAIITAETTTVNNGGLTEKEAAIKAAFNY